ncbi:hypothetical protein RFM41_32025 [Mesorhizobium sp. VK25A]|uniref:Uncharacterized protein n=1 Tax=Mesorhizobium vachelliae TaxID=3072309 RepID=A0ABU5AED8_9HYPH|nr:MULTISPECIES: hypothetical protein [unclassified Mesorhizobium]MDX8535639.1 hypothetical protein [Mesorhizobium sp. VK25D]MDX8548391.1 hypothetical protein [Mesorhizobium sp. VK25A]
MKDDRLKRIRRFLYLDGPSNIINDPASAIGPSLPALRRGFVEEEGAGSDYKQKHSRRRALGSVGRIQERPLKARRDLSDSLHAL